MNIDGSRTQQNLLAAFAGESQARNKYTYFASAARKEGYEQIAAIFEETANHEKEHAKRILRFLNGIGDTAENLKQSAEGERHEWTSMYAEFAQIAQEEGFTQIAKFFSAVAEVEKEHEKRFNALLENVQAERVFSRDDESTRWKCRNCGYIHTGSEAPNVCPACIHPQSFYELLAENY